MSQGPGPLLDALGVRRQALRGFGLALVVGVAVFVFFVVVPGAQRSPVWYVALGFVFVTAAGLLFTAAFVAAAAYRLVRRMPAEAPTDER